MEIMNFNKKKRKMDVFNKYLMIILIGIAVLGVIGFFAIKILSKDRDKKIIKKK